MKIKVILFISILICSCSRAQKTEQKTKSIDENSALEFYNSIEKQIDYSKTEGQDFINALTVCIFALKNSKDVKVEVETKNLKTLYKSAKRANKHTLVSIKKIPEFDSKTNLKTTAVEYYTTFAKFYQEVIPKVIKIIGGKGKDRYKKIVNLAIKPLKLIKQKEIALNMARKNFRAKYLKQNRSVTRTEADFEFVKLEKLQFKIITIPDSVEVRLLSYSGGYRPSEKNTYYKQFIVINKKNEDTLRVLAPAKLQDYDLDKAPRSGIYVSNFSSKNSLSSKKGAYVIFNTNQKTIERGNYKTIIGILKFEK